MTMFVRDKDRYLMYRTYIYKVLPESNFYSVAINDSIAETFRKS